jgi:beta-mannosidase
MVHRSLAFLYIVILVFSSCRRAPTFSSIDIHLASNWEFHKAGDKVWLPAKIPGDVITDLFQNEKIDDPFVLDNEKKIKWIENEDWEYRTTFDAPLDVQRNDQVFLHFAGLDTYADIYLNGILMLRTDNMFRSWDIPCKGKLKERDNTLRIYFHSAVKTGMEKLKRLSYILPVSNEQAPEDERTSVFTRKAAFQYGFDGGPRMVSCGIWRPISLRAWSKAYITDIYLTPQQITTELADYTATIDVLASKEGVYDLNFYMDDTLIGSFFKIGLKSGVNHEKFNFQITKPNIWWCNGMGDHHLYNLKVEILQKKMAIAEKSQRFGVRKLELIQDSDKLGRNFYFRLNGIPVFMKGANYIPPDILITRVTNEKYEKLTNDAVASNMNMLRIWGGGIYENDSLYDLCDRKGLLIWQDFMFSGAMQPGDSAHLENIRQEAICNVKRLRNHPCLALWCGNDKNTLDWNKLGWKSKYPHEISEKIWNDNEKLFQHILPAVIKGNDPMTPYWISAPSSYNNQGPDNKSGNDQEWKVWFETAPFSAYYERPGRFVNEFGMQSFPSLKTLGSFATEDDFNARSPLMNFRQRCYMAWISSYMNGNQMIEDYIQMYYNDPSDFESFVYVSQVMQSEALKTAVESFRINRPGCMGALYWQFNDCWPTISWSSIDYYGRWKPAQYTLKRSFSNLLVVPRLTAGKVQIFAVNDSLASLKAELRLRLIDFDGHSISHQKDSIVLLPDTVQQIWQGSAEQLCPGPLAFKTCLLVQIRVNRKVIAENILYFTDPKFIDLPLPDISSEIKGVVNHFELVLVSDKLAKNVVLETSDKDASFSDNNFDLLPGRTLHLWVIYPGTREELQNDLKINSLVNSY